MLVGEQAPPLEAGSAELAREGKGEGAVEQRACARGIVDVSRDGEGQVEGLAVVRDAFENSFEVGEGEGCFTGVAEIEVCHAQAQRELGLGGGEGEPGFEQRDQGLPFPQLLVDAGEGVLDGGIAGGLEQRGSVALGRLVEVTHARRQLAEAHAPGQPFALAREPFDRFPAEREELPIGFGTASSREDLGERFGDLGHGAPCRADRLEQLASSSVVGQLAPDDPCEPEAQLIALGGARLVEASEVGLEDADRVLRVLRVLEMTDEDLCGLGMARIELERAFVVTDGIDGARLRRSARVVEQQAGDCDPQRELAARSGHAR